MERREQERELLGARRVAGAHEGAEPALGHEAYRCHAREGGADDDAGEQEEHSRAEAHGAASGSTSL
ncbi:MAG: hypothetical protein A2177_05455 [Spirochaetes bacterium RBG_13_68_11]|nr:MAG: hypothetical protein A2177_05455 [Spirochaetes bacterium RBG_13_68_11]